MIWEVENKKPMPMTWRRWRRLVLEEFWAVGVGAVFTMAACLALAWYFWGLVGPS